MQRRGGKAAQCSERLFVRHACEDSVALHLSMDLSIAWLIHEPHNNALLMGDDQSSRKVDKRRGDEMHLGIISGSPTLGLPCPDPMGCFRGTFQVKIPHDHATIPDPRVADPYSLGSSCPRHRA